MEKLDSEYEFFISGNTPSSKNSKQFTGAYFVDSDVTKKWRKVTRDEWGNHKYKVKMNGQPVKYTKKIKGTDQSQSFDLRIEYGGGQRMWFSYLASFLPRPLYVELTFIRNSRRKFDYINAAQAVLDEMVDHGWIEDDNTSIVKPYFGDTIYNKQNPGCIIRLLKQKPELWESSEHQNQ